MKLTIVSDLHLEFEDLELPGGEVLILAGDICEAKNIQNSSYDPAGITFPFENRKKRPDRYIRFFKEECAKYDRVFYVMGNHEHYHGRFDQTADIIRAILPANVTLLENDSVTYGGYTFIGATLWTDCNRNDPLTIQSLKDMMNDYRVVKNYYKDRGQYHRLTPQHTATVHKRTLEYFKAVIDNERDRAVVIITHHSPSFASVPEKFKLDTLMNGGYASDLSNFILDNTNIKLWIHGHMHDPVDYTIGDTRIVANPRGYVGYEPAAFHFTPLVIEL